MDDFDRIFNVNVRSHFQLTKLLIEKIKKCKGLVVIKIKKFKVKFISFRLPRGDIQ